MKDVTMKKILYILSMLCISQQSKINAMESQQTHEKIEVRQFLIGENNLYSIERKLAHMLRVLTQCAINRYAGVLLPNQLKEIRELLRRSNGEDRLIELQSTTEANIVHALNLVEKVSAQGTKAPESAIQEALTAITQANELVNQALNQHSTIATLAQHEHIQSQNIHTQLEKLRGERDRVSAEMAKRQTPAITVITPIRHRYTGARWAAAPSAWDLFPQPKRWFTMKDIDHRPAGVELETYLLEMLAANKFDSALDTMFVLAQDGTEDLGQRLRKITPLFYAIEQKNLAFVQFLEPLPFWYQVWGQDKRPIEAAPDDLYLGQTDRGLTQIQMTPLEYAITLDASDIAVWMIKCGNPAHRSSRVSALAKAIDRNMLTVMKALLESPGDNLFDQIQLQCAPSAEALKLLVQYGETMSSRAPSYCEFGNIPALWIFAINWQKYIAHKGWMRKSKNGETPLLFAAICNNTEALREFFTAQLALVPARYSARPKTEQGPHFDNKATDLFKPQARYYINAHDFRGLSALMYLARYSRNIQFINNLLPYGVYAINAGNKLYTEEVLKAAQEAARCGNDRIACALLNACMQNAAHIIFGEEAVSTAQIRKH